MNHVSLFAGIGAADIAAEQLGYETTFAVEIDPFCQKVLAKRFPSATILGDIREVKGSDLGHVDLMTGGSPCQGLSSAGLGLGLDDHRSILWFEYLRLIEEARPSVVLLENVAVLRSRGLDVVVNGLATIGYGCWWDCIPALAVGAPHLRDRIWLTAVPYEDMPELEGESFKTIVTKFPRAGASTTRGLIEMQPQATIKMCKEAMGAVKREDGVTWLTAIDSPLFPTPSSSYGSNRGGAAGRVGPIRHSLASMAKSGEWPRLWPTPITGDANGSRIPIEGTSITGRRPNGTKAPVSLAMAVRGEQARMWPTPHGMSHPNAPRAAGPSGNELGNAVNRESRLWPSSSSSRDWKDTGEGRMGRGQLPEAVRAEGRLWPTATAHPRTHTPRPVHHGMQLANEVAFEEQRIWPTAAAADSMRGPGRSPHRTGGPNLRTAVADDKPGPLNSDWVEWLMKIPVGWTDLSCDDPIQYDNLSEYHIPRTAADIPHRKDRLMAIGNSLVWPVAYTRIEQAHRLLGIHLPVEHVEAVA